MEEKNLELDRYTLTDEDGNESEYELIATCEMNGNTYYALIPADADTDGDFLEYVILKLEKQENGEEYLVSVDDEDEEYEDYSDLNDDEDFEGEDDEEYYEVECPSCGEKICFTEDLDLDELVCPACGEKLADVECDGNCDSCEGCDAE